MEEGGYSRERAQTTLLREIARGDNNPPGDEEVSLITDDRPERSLADGTVYCSPTPTSEH